LFQWKKEVQVALAAKSYWLMLVLYLMNWMPVEQMLEYLP
jgi:hypothetical protein